MNTTNQPKTATARQKKQHETIQQESVRTGRHEGEIQFERSQGRPWSETADRSQNAATITKGPWLIAGHLDSLHVYAESEHPGACDGVRRIALVTQGDYEYPDYNEAKANASLIASAPELLAALQDALGVLEANAAEFEASGFGETHPEVLARKKARYENARSAIARATAQPS